MTVLIYKVECLFVCLFVIDKLGFLTIYPPPARDIPIVNQHDPASECFGT